MPPPDPNRRKRGRPKGTASTFAPVAPDQHDEVAKLLETEDGISKLENQLYVRIRAGGTVLEQEAQNRELRFLKDRRANLRAKREAEQDARLASAIEEMNRRQASKAGNALRRDMAPAPPPARGQGSLQ